MNKNKNTNRNKTVKTYCYGKLHEFPSMKKAVAFYFNAINGSEGSERDRYIDIYSKLVSNYAPFCDCDGVPETKEVRRSEALTDEDISKAEGIVIAKRDVASELDNLRAKLELKKIEFNRENKELIDGIKKLGELYNNLSLELISYEKRGFKV